MAPRTIKRNTMSPASQRITPSPKASRSQELPANDFDSEIAKLQAQSAALQAQLAAMVAEKERLAEEAARKAREAKSRARRFNFKQYDSSDPAIAGEFVPRVLPEGSYGKTAQLHADILKLAATLGVVRASDIIRELGLSRANADYHLQKMAATGQMYVLLEPENGQTRFAGTRDLTQLRTLIETHGEPAGALAAPAVRRRRPNARA
jgi:hypothetical protein